MADEGCKRRRSIMREIRGRYTFRANQSAHAAAIRNMITLV